MGDIDIEVDDSSLKRTLKAVEHAVHDAEKDALESILSKGEDVASSEVLQERRPYTTPHLHSSFNTVKHDLGGEFQGFVTNPLEHAAYIDQGVSGTEVKRDTPFEYTDSMPPLEEMIKFVKERMGSWSLDDPPYSLYEQTRSEATEEDLDSFQTGDRFTVKYISNQSDSDDYKEVEGEITATDLDWLSSGGEEYLLGEIYFKRDGDESATRRLNIHDGRATLEYKVVTDEGAKWRELADSFNTKVLYEPEDNLDSPETGGEKEISAQAWNVGDVLTDGDNTYEILEEDEERGGFYIVRSDRSEESEFKTYQETFDSFDHSLLDGNDIPATLAYRDTFQKFKRNFASGTRWENSDKALSSLNDDDIIEFDLQSGDKAYAFVLPDEDQDSSTDSKLVEVFALRPSDGDLAGEIVNNHDYRYGIEPRVEVSNPTREWTQSELDLKPYFDGEITESIAEQSDKFDELESRQFTTDNIDVSDIEVDDVVIIEEDGSLKERTVYDITDKEIVFYNSDGYNTIFEDQNDIKIVGFTKEFTPAPQVESGDEILISNPTSDLNGEYILAKVDKIIDGGNIPKIEFHRRYGQKKYTTKLKGRDFVSIRDDKPGAWDLKGLDDKRYKEPYRVTFEDEGFGSSGVKNSNKIREGLLQVKRDFDDNYSLNGEIRISFYDEDGNYISKSFDTDSSIYSNVRQINKVGKQTNLPNSFDADPGIDESIDWITSNSTGIQFSEVKETEEVILWDKIEERFTNGVVTNKRTSTKSVKVRTDEDTNSSVRVEYGSSGTHSDSKFGIVAQTDSSQFDNSRNLPRNNEQRPKLFYGQKIAFEYDNKDHQAYVTDWSKTHIEVEGTEAVDKIPLNATVEAINDARLKDFEDWTSLTRSEKIQQIENEWKFRINSEYSDLDFVRNFTSKVSNDLLSSFKNIEDIRNITARVDEYSQFSDYGGSISPNGSTKDSYTYTINESKFGLYQSSITNSTFHHEFEHAFLYSKGFSNDKIATAGAENFQVDYPTIDFKEDGTVGSNGNHASLAEMMFRKIRFGESPSDLNQVDFSDVDLTYGVFDEFEPTSLTDSDFDSVDDNKEFILNEVADSDDIIKVETDGINSGVIEHIAIVKDIDSSTGILEAFSINKGKSLRIRDVSLNNTIVGHYEVDDDVEKITDTERVNENWSPLSSDRIRRYAETANRSLKRRLWAANSDDKKTRDILEINRSYHTANAQESVTGITEVFQAKEYSKASQITQIYKTHTEFVKAYLELHNPSETAEKVIRQSDELDPLEQYL